MSQSEKIAIAVSVKVFENVNQGILSTGKNHRNNPSIATHFMQNHSSPTESPSSAYSEVRSYAFHTCSIRNSRTTYNRCVGASATSKDINGTCAWGVTTGAAAFGAAAAASKAFLEFVVELPEAKDRFSLGDGFHSCGGPRFRTAGVCGNADGSRGGVSVLIARRRPCRGSGRTDGGQICGS